MKVLKNKQHEVTEDSLKHSECCGIACARFMPFVEGNLTQNEFHRYR